MATSQSDKPNSPVDDKSEQTPTQPARTEPPSSEQSPQRQSPSGPSSGQNPQQRQGPTGQPSGQNMQRQGQSGPPPKRPMSEQARTWLGHPLLLLLVGAIVTGFLVPSFTHRWQQAQTAQQMKTGLITDITSATTTAMTQLEVSMNPILNSGVPGNSLNNRGVPPAYANWTSQAAKATSEVNAYFPEDNIPTHWSNVVGLIKNFFLLTYATDPGMRHSYINSINHYFAVHHTNTGVNWAILQRYDPASGAYRSSWTKLEKAINNVRDSVTAAIMGAPAPSF